MIVIIEKTVEMKQSNVPVNLEDMHRHSQAFVL